VNESFCNQLIEKLLKDPKIDVREDGTIWRKYADSYKGGGQGRQGQWRQVGLTIDKGYYFISYNYCNLKVSRIVYRKFHGELVLGMEVDHIDGKRGNDDPSNLQQISKTANTRKANSPLTEEEVIRIRQLAIEGISQYELAVRFGVTRSAIAHIIHHRTWRDL
jgi:hypothetical protein